MARTVTESDISTLAGPLKMLASVRRAGVCYYIGAGYDLINPLINTECKRLVCVDLIDPFYYPALNLDLALPHRIERDVHLYGVMNRFVTQWVQLSEINSEFGRITKLGLRNNRLEIHVSYKNLKRQIAFYSGIDGNKTPRPREIKTCASLVMYISMGHITPTTIKKLHPAQIIVYHTTLNSYLKRRAHKVVVGSRIDPFSGQLRVFVNEKYLIFD